MNTRAWARAFEQRCLRPLARVLRWPRRGGRVEGRLDQLERRVAELEGLARELTGLAYLELDGREPAAGRHGGASPARPGEAREAA